MLIHLRQKHIKKKREDLSVVKWHMACECEICRAEVRLFNSWSGHIGLKTFTIHCCKKHKESEVLDFIRQMPPQHAGPIVEAKAPEMKGIY